MLTGIALGAANIVPGISGATLAVIFRIYDRLIASINALFTDTKKSLLFLVPVGIGMVIGILAVGTLLSGLFRQFSFQTSALIAGLVAGGIPFIYRQAISKDKEKPLYTYSDDDGNVPVYHAGHKLGGKPLYYVVAVIAAIVIILLALVVPTPTVEAAEFNLGLAVLLFVGGLTAAAALVIPGVSGAMVMMLFGLLPTVMDTIAHVTDYLRAPSEFERLVPIMQVGIPLGLGIVAGILLASKLIAILLKRYFSITYFAILGMVIGTIFAVFSDPDTYYNVDRMTAGLIIAGIIAFIVGAVVALMFGNRPVADNTEQ